MTHWANTPTLSTALVASPKLHPNCKPVIHPPQKVPITIWSKVRKELERMERLDVIERVYEPTDWVNSMVTVIKKNEQLHICIDPCDLKRAIKCENSQRDSGSNAQRQILLSSRCQFRILAGQTRPWSCNLCTFNTPFGQYMFKILPFGICSAQDIFQIIMSLIFHWRSRSRPTYSYGELVRNNTTPD